MNRNRHVRLGATASRTLILALSSVGTLTFGIAFAHSTRNGQPANPPSSPSKSTNSTKSNAKKSVAATKAGSKAADNQTKIGTLYLIGYSHLDTEWNWCYPQVIDEFVKKTLDQNFALFQKYPDYIFNWTGSNRYRFMKEYYPTRYAELKKYVAAGRWYPAGSSIEEGDVNNPSGEGIIRQVLYGNEFFRDEFGMASTEFMLPDCFGFPASLPSILAYSGLKGFSTQKLTWGSAVGIPFNVGEWIGPDDQPITAALNPGSYTSRIEDDLSNDSYWVNRMKKNVAESGVGVDYHYYGTGDTGGAPDEQSVENMEKSIHADGPLRVVSSRADTMFNILTPAQKKALPKYKGDLELTWHSAGSLSSEGAMKRWNRKNEYLGDNAEKASLAAGWLGAQKYPQARITDAWLRFLPGQFHDLLAGTALPTAYNYAWNDQVIAMNEFADVIQQSVGAVSRGLNTQVPTADSASLVVYNPLSIRRQDVVDAHITFPHFAPKFVKVIGPDGHEVPSQVDGRDGNTVHVVFLATVPSLGFANYTVSPASAPYKGETGLHVNSSKLSSQRYIVKLDGQGDVSSIFDRSIGKELLSGPARLAFQYENPSQWPAWNMDWEDQSQPPRGYVVGPADVKVVENGPVRVSLEVTRKTLGSVFHQTIRLAAGSAGSQVVFDNKIDWQGKETALKATFPLTASNPNATYNLGPGTIQRDNNNPKRYEDLSHGWFDVTDRSGKWGTTILDDCKNGSDKPNDNTVRLTMIYTPGIRGGYQHQATQDWGRNIMTYCVMGHAGDWRTGDSQWQAARLNQPLQGFQVPSHGGSMGRDLSFASVNTNQVSIESMKKAEKSNRTVVRLYELLGKPAHNVTLKFASPIVSFEEVNGQEFKIAKTGPVRLKNGELVFDMTKYRPRSFAVTLASDSHGLQIPTSHEVALPYNVSVESAWSHKTDARFNSEGDSIPGDLMPKNIESGGVNFVMAGHGPKEKNAVACEGQTLTLPQGRNRKLYFLAASSEGDISAASFMVGGNAVPVSIQNWNGFIGQWDNRMWGGVVPREASDWYNPLVGLQPGFIKRDNVAWYADHYRKADGSLATYNFCYLFRYELSIPNGVNKVTLPNLPQIKVLAASVASNPNDVAKPIQPLYDVLNRHNENGPQIAPSGGSFDHELSVTLYSPVYWNPSTKLHYTLDGSEPTSDSPVYTKPISLDAPTTVKVAEVNEEGKVGAVTSEHFDIHDTVPPTVASCISMKGMTEVDIAFSKAMNVSDLENTANYAINESGAPAKATAAADGRSVRLQLSAPLEEGSPSITFSNLVDQSVNSNKLSGDSADIRLVAPVVTLDEEHSLDGTTATSVSQEEPNLPVEASHPWTINVWVKPDEIPGDVTAIAGFGSAKDNGGHQRYLCSFDGNLHFWGSNVDVSTGTGFTVGQWQMVTMTFDGKDLKIYSNGQEVASQGIALDNAQPVVKLGPASPWGYGSVFKGSVKGFTVFDTALPASFISSLYQPQP